MRMVARASLGVFVLGMAIVVAANPYRAISDRNSFSLRPPESNIAPPVEASKPRADIKLTGVAAFGSHKWVLLTKADAGKVPQHFMLREGEQTDGIEVVGVDEIAAIAKIRTEGALLELKLATNSLSNIDMATQRFVNDHTRAHEQHQRREAVRIARERGEAERLQRIPRMLEPRPANLDPAMQATPASQ